MFSYEILDVIFSSFKKIVDKNLKNVIDASQKYVAGRQEYKLFLCSRYEIDTDSITEKLNLLKCEFSKELVSWSDFGLSSGFVDHDLTLYLFYSESVTEKKAHEQFVSLAIN